MLDKNNGTCSVCDNDADRHVRVVYSRNPWGEDYDDVDLCTRHIVEAQNQYEVIKL